MVRRIDGLISMPPLERSSLVTARNDEPTISCFSGNSKVLLQIIYPIMKVSDKFLCIHFGFGGERATP